MRKLLLFSFVFIFSISSLGLASAQENKSQPEIKLFFSPTCPHCEQEKEFLSSLEKKYKELKIEQYSTFRKESVSILNNLYEQFEVPLEDRGYVPVTFIDDRCFIGFNKNIAKKIEDCVVDIINEEPCEEGVGEKGGVTSTEKSDGKPISIPIIGEIETSHFSSLALAIIMGGLDGFNACAMVALAFLLAVLIGTGVRKRVFLIGGVFIFVSGIVYFLFMTAWLNLFLVLEQVKFITIIVGVVIILFSLVLLKDYFYGVVCKLCRIDPGKKSLFSGIEKGLLSKMKFLIRSDLSLPLVLIGVAVVAAGVNLVELVCSFGFPLAFTKILTARELPAASYYFYIFIYILFYMLDDMIIFTVAILTLRITKVSDKYLKAVKLISGIVLLALGVVMLFYPEFLTF